MGVPIAVTLFTLRAKGTSSRWLALLLGLPDLPGFVADRHRRGSAQFR